MGSCLSSSSHEDQKKPLIKDGDPVLIVPNSNPLPSSSRLQNTLEKFSDPSYVSLDNETNPYSTVTSVASSTGSSYGETFSPETYQRSMCCKIYFLDYYFNLLTYLKARRERSQRFKALLLSKDMTESERQEEWNRHFAKERSLLRSRRQKLKLSDFHLIIKVGEGAYGEVFLCKKKDTGELCAVKRVDKKVLFLKENIDQVKTEKIVMSSSESPWIVKLLYSFQDKDYVYLAMEFVPGGDLRTLLRNSGILYEDQARFYAAEIIMGLEDLHSMGYTHRDLKPDNILISSSGHLLLSDFGLSKGGLSKEVTKILADRLSEAANIKVEASKESTQIRRKKHLRHMMNKKLAYSLVGSPDYMAPEIMKGHGYDFRVDFWSLGCLIFEFLAGYPPFSGETVSDIWANVTNWKITLTRPIYEDEEDLEFNLSDTAWDLITALLCEKENRLGKNGIQEIKDHPFFYGFDWDALRLMTPPFVPQLSDSCDTAYFDDFNDKNVQDQYNNMKKNQNKTETEEYLLEIEIPRSAFVGFTYRHSHTQDLSQEIYLEDNKIDLGKTLF